MMFEHETVVAWMMSVPVEDFIPSLTAYAKSLPAINALRACNRHGQGPDCFVNKLPTELVDLIEVRLHAAKRQEAFAEWEQQKLCTEEKCACESHGCHNAASTSASAFASGARVVYGPDGVYDLEATWANAWRASQESLQAQPSRHRVLTCVHCTRVREFSTRTRDFRALDADDRFLQKHFNLNIWTPVRHSYDVHPEDIRLRPKVATKSETNLETGARVSTGRQRVQPQLFLVGAGSMQATCSETGWLGEMFTSDISPTRQEMRRFLHFFRTLWLLSGQQLRSLELVANLPREEDSAWKESNLELRTRMHKKLVENGATVDGRTGNAGRSWPDMLRMKRHSSWESRMQSRWLGRGSG